MDEVTEALARAAEKLTGEPVRNRDGKGWRRYFEGGERLIPPVQSDPGWWLRALWKAKAFVSFSRDDRAVRIFLRPAENYYGHADDPLDALVAALANMGGAQ